MMDTDDIVARQHALDHKIRAPLRITRTRLAGALLAALLLGSGGVIHAAGPHIHGQGYLDVTMEPGQVHLLLTAPTGDLRGADNTEEMLVTRDDLFLFPDAGCALHSSNVEDATLFTDIWGETEQEAAPAQERDHHHEHSAQHSHDHHEDSFEGEAGGHSDTYLSWTYRCALPPSTIQINLFSDTALTKLLLRVASDTGVISGEVTADTPVLNLSNQ